MKSVPLNSPRILIALALGAAACTGCGRTEPSAGRQAAASQAAGEKTPNDAPAPLPPLIPPPLIPPQPGGIHLTDVTASTGISFAHTDGGVGSLYIVQTVVAGLALLDYDNDGFVDIYFLNGAPTPGARFDKPPHNELWRNNGDWTFTNVTDRAGVGDTGYGLGVVSGDFDNDGDQDLYVNNFGPSVLYRNNGDGTFSDVTSASGTLCDECGAGAVFLDIEGDGDLDLYVANYVDFAYERNIVERIGERVFSAGPAAYRSEPDVLLRNNADGTFTDISRESGIAQVPNASMGLVGADYDDDGDTDIFVCCDNAANQLWRNSGAGRFEEVGFAAGVAYDLEGGTNGNMGVTCEDYDNDGRLDFYVTTFSGELSVLYRNTGGGFFTDMARPSQSAVSTISHAKWGTTLSDFDHDGDRDLFVACGHFWIDTRYIDDRTDVKVPNALLENLGSGTFRDISRRCGDGLAIVASSKGAGFDDMDNDGDLDAVILNANDKPSILRNDLQTPRKSVQIVLRGRGANREGVGARVKVVVDGREQISEVHRGQGYQSGYGNRLHFGLGEGRLTRIEVRWIGGQTDIIEDPPDAPLLLVTEGGHCQRLLHPLRQ
ncbi:MAG: CRTAC1 family protein [Planctomycetaceae bacterium]|nr:CRTAC1 family protein [Planctomycetaceae bacterium]